MVDSAAEARWWVYMVRCRSGRLYTGIATDVERRFAEHQGGRRGARFFRLDPPDAVVYREALADRSAASRREAEIKKLTRAAKLALAGRHCEEPFVVQKSDEAIS